MGASGSGFLRGLQSSCGQAVVSHEGSTRAGSASRLIHVVVGRTHSLQSLD